MTSTDFCRRARRIRWVHRNEALQRSRALKNLSLAFDARHSSHSIHNNLLGSARPSDALTAVRTFANRVADEIDSGTLLYSQRLRLLKEARRRGIRRFDANLIIAAVLDRSHSAALSREARHIVIPRDSNTVSNIVAIGIFMIVQSVILAVGWSFVT